MGLMPNLTDIAQFVTTQLINFETTHNFDILVTSLINYFPFCTKRRCIETELNFSSSLMFKLPNIMRKSLNYRNLIPNIITIFFSLGLGKTLFYCTFTLAKIGLVAATLIFFKF